MIMKSIFTLLKKIAGKENSTVAKEKIQNLKQLMIQSILKTTGVMSIDAGGL